MHDKVKDFFYIAFLSAYFFNGISGFYPEQGILKRHGNATTARYILCFAMLNVRSPMRNIRSPTGNIHSASGNITFNAARPLLHRHTVNPFSLKFRTTVREIGFLPPVGHPYAPPFMAWQL